MPKDEYEGEVPPDMTPGELQELQDNLKKHLHGQKSGILQKLDIRVRESREKRDFQQLVEKTISPTWKTNISKKAKDQIDYFDVVLSTHADKNDLTEEILVGRIKRLCESLNELFFRGS